jgi:hypothetical protein
MHETQISCRTVCRMTGGILQALMMDSDCEHCEGGGDASATYHQNEFWRVQEPRNGQQRPQDVTTPIPTWHSPGHFLPC